MLPVWLAWMVHVPVATSEAVDPETVQMAGVVEVKLTDRPELAVAVKERIELRLWAGIGPKLMVCWVLPVPVPLN